MANMSYCRFQNTVSDLADCLEGLRDGDGPDSRDEESAARRMRDLCEEYLEAYDEWAEDAAEKEIVS